MAIGAITPDDAGSVTTPSPAFLMSSPSALSTTAKRVGLHSWMSYPGRPGVMFTNGQDPIRHVLTAGVLRTGLLAPEVAPTVTVLGTQATTRLDCQGNALAAGDQIRLVTSDAASLIQFTTSLSPLGGGIHQVLIGGSGNTSALANLKKFINQTGVEGTDYKTNFSFTLFWDYITATTLGSDDLTLASILYGTAGNSYVCTVVVNTNPTIRFEIEGADTNQTTFSGGTAGTGSLPESGAYYYARSFYRSEDGAESGISPVSARASQGQAQNVTLTGFTAPEQSDGIDYDVWWRTFSNGRSDALQEGYRVAVADAGDTDDLGNLESDSPTLFAHQQYDTSFHRTFKDGMIPRLKFIVPYKGMWFAGGINRAAEYSIGTASVTASDNEVTLSSTAMPTKEMEKRTFALASGADSALTYTIVWVDEANRKIYLDRNYEGSTNASASYTITDKRDAFRVYRCEPLKPNQTSGTMFFDGVSSPDPSGLTGMAYAFESVLLFTKTGLSRLTGTGRDALTTRITNEFEGAGCLSHHSIVYTGGAVYWMAPDGFYSWTAGQSSPTRISNPEGQDVSTGIARTFRRINLLHAHNVFGHYDPKRNVIRWLVPMDGETSNRYALVYDVTTKRWSGPLEYPDLTVIQTVPGTDGALRTLAGDIYGDVWELDVGNCDGAFGFEPKATLTAATKVLLTASAASFPTTGDGLAGVPAILVRVTTGAMEHFVIASNTGTALTPVRPFTAAPAIGDVVMVGGIHMGYETGRPHFGVHGVHKQVGWVKTFFVADSDGQAWVSSAAEHDDPTLDASIDLTLEDGEELSWSFKHGRFWKYRFDCIEPGCDPVLLGLGVEVNVPDAVRG